jgi:hypothetical protein
MANGEDPNLVPPKEGGVTALLRKISDTELIRRTRRFSPVLIRGTLWVGIAMLTDLRTSLKTLADKGSVSTMDWTDAAVGCALAGMIAWRIFLDQAISRFNEQNGKPPTG